jgi:site-specific recombinase XerD
MADERYNLGPMAASWLRALKSENKSDNTIRIYGNATRQLAAFLLDEENGYQPTVDEDGTPGRPAPTDLDEVHREHVQAYIAATIKRTSPANAHQHYRALRTFFNWLEAEEEIDRTPMRTMKPPVVPEKEVPVIPDDALEQLLKTCKGKTYADRRDAAIITLFVDTGLRLSELTERKVADLDLDLKVLQVIGKGGIPRSVPFGSKCATTLDRYLRAAAKHKGKALEDDMWLWWGDRGQRGHRLTIWGVGTMVERRCQEAGIAHIHPHQFRHTFAHQWRLYDGNEDDLMRITGWRSRQMLARYGASAGVERARKAHARLSPADRLK